MANLGLGQQQPANYTYCHVGVVVCLTGLKECVCVVEMCNNEEFT